MANDNLRTTILKLQDYLSDIDRKNLHFILASHIPRRIRDDPTLFGTLNLMESLFDQDKISERNFTILINAFKTIKFFEGLKILEDLKKQMHLTCNPPLHQLVIDDQQYDKGVSHPLLPKETADDEHDKIKKTDRNPVVPNLDTKEMISSFSEEEQSFYISLKMNRYLFLLILLLLLGFGIVLMILIANITKTSCTTKEKTWKGKIQSLENRLQEKENEINRLPIKPGQKFGGTDLNNFDDSSSPDFVSCHYLNGLVARQDHEGLETYQFLYYSPSINPPKVQSSFHGSDNPSQIYEFEFLGENEKVERIEGVIVNKTILSGNGQNVTRSIIKAIKFFSKDHDSLSNIDPSMVNFNESFDGYTLGYVAGRAGQYIEQIQFFWYRT